jgi:hypothetical protein
MKKRLIALIGALAGIVAIVWAGLRIRPQSFAAYPESNRDLDTVELPPDLPAPVARFFKKVVGNNVPVIESAVITGSVTLRLFGLRLPGRFRITHVAGRAYRHYIEATFFGYPVMKVNESFLNDQARLELPFGVVAGEPKIDMAANLGLWAESVWLPSIWITDPRVRWESIDDMSARLVVPYGEDEDRFTVRFDPETGLLTEMAALRYRDAADETKIGWLNEPLAWQTFHGIKIPSQASVTWMDQGAPWSEWHLEEVVYNVDVSEYIKAAGL